MAERLRAAKFLSLPNFSSAGLAVLSFLTLVHDPAVFLELLLTLTSVSASQSPY